MWWPRLFPGGETEAGRGGWRSPLLHPGMGGSSLTWGCQAPPGSQGWGYLGGSPCLAAGLALTGHCCYVGTVTTPE